MSAHAGVQLRMSELIRLVVFRVGDQCYALPLPLVERIVRAVEVTPLPGAPLLVLGVIDAGGGVLPVVNIRRRFSLPEREVSPADQFLIARMSRRAVALVIDEAQGVVEYPGSAVMNMAEIVPGVDQVQGIVRLDDGLVLIQDLEKLLSPDDTHALEEAMAQDHSC